MSFFEEVLAASGAVQDVVYGELFTIEPRTKPAGDANGRPIADPARPAQDFTGVWTDKHAIVRPTNRTGHPAGESQAFGTGKPLVDFETTALPFAAKVEDWITRKATGERFAVSDTGDDGFTRAMVALTAARGART